MRSAVTAFLTIVTLVAFAGCRSGRPQQAPASAKADPKAFSGTIAETMNAGGYTYARLQAEGRDDVWIAASEFPAKTGERLTVALDMPVDNFESKTLNRTFPRVYFVASVNGGGQAGAAPPSSGPPSLMASHGSAPAASINVEPVAPPPGGLSIADIWAQRKALDGKDVTLRGTVVKVNSGILERNWIHLQDGSGSAGDRTNDLTVTTTDEVKVGDVITVKGVLATGRDIGAGYAYDAIVENAKIVK
jgi:hypothetical protein